MQFIAELGLVICLTSFMAHQKYISYKNVKFYMYYIFQKWWDLMLKFSAIDVTVFRHPKNKSMHRWTWTIKSIVLLTTSYGPPIFAYYLDLEIIILISWWKCNSWQFLRDSSFLALFSSILLYKQLALNIRIMHRLEQRKNCNLRQVSLI